MEKTLEKVGKLASEVHFIQFGACVIPPNTGKRFLEVEVFDV